jgi:hypothetical protein
MCCPSDRLAPPSVKMEYSSSIHSEYSSSIHSEFSTCQDGIVVREVVRCELKAQVLLQTVGYGVDEEALETTEPKISILVGY